MTGKEALENIGELNWQSLGAWPLTREQLGLIVGLVGAEGQLAAEDLENNDADQEKVSATIERPAFIGGDLLGSDVTAGTGAKDTRGNRGISLVAPDANIEEDKAAIGTANYVERLMSRWTT
jgi:hypothetical protein